MELEQKVTDLIAKDRIEIPLSSMYQRLKKAKKASAIDLGKTLGKERYEDERVFAYVEMEDKERARGMKEAVAEFASEFPKYGAILLGKITEKRVKSEEHLYFGVQPGARISQDQYLGVMHSLGLSQATAQSMYPDIMDISRKLQRARDEERSIIVGKYANDAE